VDDLGWNDVSWNNPDLKKQMPTIDRLAQEGFVLSHAYTHPAVAPSRAAMLTGQYSHKLGLQHGEIETFHTKHVPKNIRLLPEELKRLGYSTNLVGKWNLGHCNWSYAPTSRGFDTFYGSLHSHHQNPYTMKWDGIYDFWENRKPVFNENGAHSTDLYFQRATDIIFNHCKKCGRSKPFFIHMGLSAKLTDGLSSSMLRQKKSQVDIPAEKGRIMEKMDSGVADILMMLDYTGLLDDTLIVLTSGNGGDIASDPETNAPLRGGKSTLWEGGTRIPAVVQGRMISYGGRFHGELFHAVDWFPTLLHAAGKHPSKLGPSIDGISHWNDFLGTQKQDYKRDEIVYNIAEHSAAIRVGDYKFILGNPVEKSYGARMSELGLDPNCAKVSCTMPENCHSAIENNMLFDLAEDRSEMDNHLKILGRIGALLETRLFGHMRDMVTPQSENSYEGTMELNDGFLYPGWC
jgi:arylsulfatase A-like enzyme